MRKVLILTPTYDRTVGADYHHSALQTVKLCAQHGIDVATLLWPGEALVQHARNALTEAAVNSDASDVVWIDADHEWEPEWFLRLINHPVDVVGFAYPKKSEREQYTVRVAHNMSAAGELLIVEGLGTGFLRTSMKALPTVWEQSELYGAWGKRWRMVFDVQIVDGRMWGEDMIFCEKLKQCGFPIHLDLEFTVPHHGQKKYTGDFAAYLSRLMERKVA